MAFGSRAPIELIKIKKLLIYFMIRDLDNEFQRLDHSVDESQA